MKTESQSSKIGAMNLALYARVSTDKCEVCGKKPSLHPGVGHAFRGQDPEVQLRELREWAADNKHTIIAEYVDRGLSGKRGVVRPELNRLLVDAEKGRRDFKGVLVWRLSRFGRSFPDLIRNVQQLSDADVNFFSKQEGFQLDTTMGRFAFRIMCAAVEMEREVISENTIAGMKLARAAGRIPGPKIDPKKGPSRWTLRRRQKAKEVA
jgi:DNA invertase Pin-like site-specific DNA recombinase